MTISAAYRVILEAALTRLVGEMAADLMDELVASIPLVRTRVGTALYRQGDEGHTLHILLSGRLQVRVTTPEGPENVVAYPQPGEVVGEMSLFSGGTRAATIIAVRDSMLGVISRDDIDRLVARCPQVSSNLARLIIARLRNPTGHIQRSKGARSVMILPLHRRIDIQAFTASLTQALLRFGSVISLDANTASRRVGAVSREEYGHYLDHLESSYDYVLLNADAGDLEWTRICHGYADRVLMIADAQQEPELTEVERLIFSNGDSGAHFARTELVLLHDVGTNPKNTRHWLAPRRHVKLHHHLQKSRTADLERLARFVSGNAIGLVLAGGGARGFAHLGVIRALHQAGISVDSVGGTSFGALAATGLARGIDDISALEELRIAFTRDDPLRDYTIPVMSLIRGEHLNRILAQHLPMDIEDLWIPYFAVSSDLSANSVRIHETGPLWRAIRATVSLPAILPPVLEDGHLLVDGGVLNNLPVDVMHGRLQGVIIAVDLAVDNDPATRQTEIPSAAEYIKSRLLPGKQTIDAPTLSRVILKVTTLASRKEVQNARKLADLYLNPPVGDFDLLDWAHMREIAEIGYQHSLPRVREWLGYNPRHVERSRYMDYWLQQTSA